MKKSVYIFLCMVLGVLLFVVIQRSLVVLYYIQTSGEQALQLLSPNQENLAQWGSLALAVIIGALYGHYLGTHWYKLIYEDGDAPAASKPAEVRVKPVRASSRAAVAELGGSWDFDDLVTKKTPDSEAAPIHIHPTLRSSAVTKPVGKTPVKPSVKLSAKPAVKSSTKSAASSSSKAKSAGLTSTAAKVPRRKATVRKTAVN